MIFTITLSHATWAAMKEWRKKFRPERDSNPDHCNASVVLYQLSYWANWKLDIMWVYDKPVGRERIYTHDVIYTWNFMYMNCGWKLCFHLQCTVVLFKTLLTVCLSSRDYLYNAHFRISVHEKGFAKKILTDMLTTVHTISTIIIIIVPWLKKIIWVIGVLRRTVVRVTDVSTTCAEAIFIVKW